MDNLEQRNQDLFIELKNGNLKARENLILGNLAYVNYVFNKNISCKKEDRDDYIQVGVIGLIKAIDTYKPGFCKFSTYSYKCIQNEMLLTARKLNKHKAISLDTPMCDKLDTNREDSLGNILASNECLEEVAIENNQKEVIKNFVFNQLPERQAEILRLRYYSDENCKSQKEVADTMSYSQSYISRQETAAINAIRVAMAAEY